MNEEHHKSGLKNTKADLLDDLEDLSGMLDEDNFPIEKELTQPYDLEDLPVLKSFVEDVPTLNETLQEEQQVELIPPSTDTDRSSDSYVDDDPLAISPEVRKQHSSGSRPIEQPQELRPEQAFQASAPETQAEPESPRTLSTDNPFLPKSALDKLQQKEAYAPLENKASQELRNLVKQRSLPKFYTNSKEFLALRNDASKMVNEVIKLFIPRIEAELRMRLEKEVDEYLKELRKNAED